jgi:signal transduction histidine kinase
MGIIGTMPSRKARKNRSPQPKKPPALDLDLFGRQRALGWMIAGFVHQFRTPLQVLQTNLEAVREAAAVPAPAQASLEMMQRSLERLQSSVGQLLGFAGGSSVAKTPGSIDRALSLLADFLKEESRRRGLDLEMQLRTTRLVDYDIYALQEAVLNLCMNAFQAMPDGGRLRVESRDFGAKQVEVRVSDTGTGMTPTTVKRLGEAFHSETSGGVGLGVYFTRRVVADHRGTLRFESQLGRGTTAILVFPASAAPTAPGDTPSRSDPA